MSKSKLLLSTHHPSLITALTPCPIVEGDLHLVALRFTGLPFDFEERHGLRAVLDEDRVALLERVAARGGARRRIRHQNLPALRVRFQTRGRVDRVADGGVF